jgi:ribosomal protein L37E
MESSEDEDWCSTQTDVCSACCCDCSGEFTYQDTKIVVCDRCAKRSDLVVAWCGHTKCERGPHQSFLDKMKNCSTCGKFLCCHHSLKCYVKDEYVCESDAALCQFCYRIVAKRETDECNRCKSRVCKTCTQICEACSIDAAKML